MAHELWTAVDHYHEKHLLASDPALEAALRYSTEQGLPPIAVSPTFGKFLQMLLQVQGARRVLEVGTLGGYSTIWLSRALPADGVLISLELDEHHADVARHNLVSAGVKNASVVVGAAAASLQTLIDDGEGPFDFIFIDADKPSNPVYLELADQLCRPGGLILVDNVVRDGQVADPTTEDANSLGVRAMNDLLGRKPHLEATSIQTVGSKGYDGFCLIRKA